MAKSLTILAYHFWADSGNEFAFEKLAAAYRETWRQCGRRPSVLVTNRAWPHLERFAAENPPFELQVEPTLVPGQLHSMSVDCNSRLYSRFETDYVLIVQNDGWPLRPGVEEFLGRWDFIGGSHIRNRWWTRWGARMLGRHPMNGGFSLRSRECCARAAWYWNRRYKDLCSPEEACEDGFYTDYLVRREPDYRRQMRFPGVAEAMRFAHVELGEGFTGRELPFGFHGFSALNALKARNMLK